MPNLKGDVKDAIGLYCKDIFSIIKEEKTKIRGIVIQLNNGNIFIGSNVRGSFSPIYYSELYDGKINERLHDYIMHNSKCIHDCKNEIDNRNPNRRLRSFNIFYKADGSINICENKIGNMGISRCRLFEQFSILNS